MKYPSFYTFGTKYIPQTSTKNSFGKKKIQTKKHNVRFVYLDSHVILIEVKTRM